MIVLLLPLSLVWKLYAGADDPDEFTKRAFSFLGRSGYEVSITNVMAVGSMQAVRAAKGDCLMFVVNRGSGWTHQLMGALGEDTSRYFTVFRGRIFDGDPAWPTAVANIYFRGLRRLGLTRSTSVIGVTASEGCDLELLAWTDF
jgi:hypothetical protein